MRSIPAFQILSKKVFYGLCSLIFLQNQIVFGQDTVNVGLPFGQIFELKIAARQVTGDPFLATYAIDAADQILRFDETGKPTGRFSDARLGVPTRIDASGPANSLLVWYPEHHLALWLNASLVETARLDLARDAGITNARMIAPSADGNLWVYDETAFQLKKIDRQSGQLLASSAALNLAFPLALEPEAIQEYNNQVFFNNPKTGILLFDGLGQYQKTLAEQGIHDFFISDNKIQWATSDDLIVHGIHAKHWVVRKNSPFPKGFKFEECRFFVNRRRLYVIKNGSVEAWVIGLD